MKIVKVWVIQKLRKQEEVGGWSVKCLFKVNELFLFSSFVYKEWVGVRISLKSHTRLLDPAFFFLLLLLPANPLTLSDIPHT